MDIVLSLLLIILFSPVMIVIAIAIKMHDKGPVLFKQKRYTKDGKVFNILKFRSMIVDAEKDGEVIPAEDNDPRITPVGKVIRKIRMDELPQLFNILKGDMSVVGPRPERVEHVDMYSEQIPEFRYRLKVKGGLTGYAQVLGKYNTSPYDKLRLDLIYIENYSLLLDLKLMLTTIKILFKPESTEGFNKGDEKR
jgi:exopolysaccharide biosynthesis polyprenyl glycosylphosphotransferase